MLVCHIFKKREKEEERCQKATKMRQKTHKNSYSLLIIQKKIVTCNDKSKIINFSSK